MLTKTSQLAIRSLLWIAQQEAEAIFPPRRIAEALGESPSYTAKVTRALVKAGILRAEKGVKGGVCLDRPPGTITLLAVVEACQGALVGDYCRSECDPARACSYHMAAHELHLSITGVLSRWTLARLLVQPELPRGNNDLIPCLMTGVSGNQQEEEH
jgi:Rrf2 family protein